MSVATKISPEVKTAQALRRICLKCPSTLILALLLLMNINIGKAQTLPTIANPQSNFDLPAGSRSTTFTISLKADAGVLSKVVFPDTYPEYVQTGANSDEAFRKAVTLKYDTAAANLAVKVAMPETSPQGVYNVSVRYIMGKEKTVGHLTFILTRSTASLESVNTVTIVRIGSETQAEAVVLRETGNKTSAADLRFSDPYLPGTDGTGLLRFDAGTYLVPAGQVRTISYHVMPAKLLDIPLGTSTGKLYVNSSSLSAPVAIPFVVTRRVWPGWIVIMVLAGLALSYGVKQVLAIQKDNEGVRVAGYRLISEVLAFARETQDTTYTNKLTECNRQVKAIIDSTYGTGGADAAQATAQIQERRTAFLKIKTEFYDILDDLRKRFQTFDEIIYHDNLSPSVNWSLAQAKQYLDDLFKKIDAKHPTAALAAEQHLKDELEGCASRYQGYFASVRVLLELPCSFPDGSPRSQAAAKAKLETIATTLSAALTSDPQDPARIIIRINAQQGLLESLTDTLEGTLKEDLADAKLTYTDNDKLGLAVSAWTGQIGRILRNTAKAGDAQQYPLKTLVDQLNEAVKNAATPLAAEATPETFGLRGTFPVVLALQDQGQTLVMPDQTAANPDYQFSNDLGRPEDAAILLSRTRERYWLLSLLQTAVLALLLSFGAYSSLQATFVGRPGDFIGMLLLGFSMDIVVSNVAQFKIKTP